MSHLLQRCVETSLVEITAATTDPVTKEEAKNHLRIGHAEDDADIVEMITSATKQAEMRTERQFITATWELRLDRFPSLIELRKNPVASVSSVKYVDINGTTQTVATTVYDTDTDQEPGRIFPSTGQNWPVPKDQLQAVQVQFVAGYGAASSVPAKVKRLIKLLVEQEYYNNWDKDLQRAIDNMVSELRWTEPL